VSWGRQTNSSRRIRSIHFGSYNWTRNVIRIHPDLDRDYVPRYFIESVLLHEMLHVDLGVSRTSDGRRSSHSREFKRRECDLPNYERAREWERAHLHYFLRGTPRALRQRSSRPAARGRRAARSAVRRAAN